MESSQTSSLQRVRVIDARLEHIFISPGHDYWGKHGEGRPQNGIRDVAEVECVAGRGLVGDRYFGGKANKAGQVTFFEAETVEQVRRHFDVSKLPASVFRRNLIVRGVRLSELLDQRFEFQGITFEGAQECKPCIWMDRVVADGGQAFLKQFFRGGLRCRILTDGVLRVSAAAISP